jgi:hypothetical protein
MYNEAQPSKTISNAVQKWIKYYDIELGAIAATAQSSKHHSEEYKAGILKERVEWEGSTPGFVIDYNKHALKQGVSQVSAASVNTWAEDRQIILDSGRPSTNKHRSEEYKAGILKERVEWEGSTPGFVIDYNKHALKQGVSQVQAASVNRWAKDLAAETLCVFFSAYFLDQLSLIFIISLSFFCVFSKKERGDACVLKTGAARPVLGAQLPPTLRTSELARACPSPKGAKGQSLAGRYRREYL